MSSSSFDEARPLASECKHISSPRRRQTWTEKVRTPLLVLNVSILATVERLKQPERAQCFDDNLLDPPIVWESRTFNSVLDKEAGVVKDRITPSSPIMTADWSAVLDVGEIALSNEEAARLPQKTARLYGGEDGYAGVLEVFHQLHCLHRIRQKFYNASAVKEDPDDSASLRRWHDRHCFDYLWQTLLCHADVSVMTVGWNERQQAFNGNFAVTKQCRNFEAIHNWAKNREAKFKPPGDTHPGAIE